MVINQITVNNFASLSGCTPVDRASKIFDGSGLKTFKCRLVPDALALVGPTIVQLLVCFRLLQQFSYFLLSSPHRCFISVFI